MSAVLILQALLVSALGALVGALWPALGVWRGGAAGLWVWVFWQAWRSGRLLRWLRQGAPLDAALPRAGFWGECADRIRRALRLRDQQVAQHQERLQSFLHAIEASPNGVTLLDAQGRIDWCNETASAHLGIDPERDHAQHIVHLVRDPVFTRYFTEMQASGEVVIEGRSATLARSVKLSVQRFAYGQGQQLLLSRDITVTAQAEAMRRDFVANVSHEIRTPLTVLAGFIETLQSLPLSAQEQKNYLDLMAQQAMRMQTLVQDLLTLSQLEGSPVPGKSDPVALVPLMAQLEQEARALSAAQTGGGQPVHELVFGPVPQVELMGALTEVHSAMSNLVSNAVRYTPAGGRIEVQWHPESTHWVFSVRDSGPGIAPEHLPRLTERFYRVDRSRSRETGGTGLGLAIVKHVVQRHGGELRIESRPGEGACFMLAWPASRVVPAR